MLQSFLNGFLNHNNTMSNLFGGVAPLPVDNYRLKKANFTLADAMPKVSKRDHSKALHGIQNKSGTGTIEDYLKKDKVGQDVKDALLRYMDMSLSDPACAYLDTIAGRQIPELNNFATKPLSNYETTPFDEIKADVLSGHPQSDANEQMDIQQVMGALLRPNQEYTLPNETTDFFTARDALSAYQKEETQRLTDALDKLNDPSEATNFYKIMGLPYDENDPIPFSDEDKDKINTFKEIIINMQKQHHSEQVQELEDYREMKAIPLLMDAYPSGKPENNLPRAHLRNLRNYAQKREIIQQRTERIKDKIDNQAIKSPQALNMLLRKENELARKALVELHAEEYRDMQERLEDTEERHHKGTLSDETSQSLDAIAQFHGYESFSSSPGKELLKEHHQQMLDSLKTSQQEELKKFDKDIQEQVNALHNLQMEDDLRIHVIRSLMKENNALASHQGINEDADMDTVKRGLATGGFLFRYDQQNDALQIIFESTVWSRLFNTSPSGFSENALHEMLAASRAMGKTPIKIRISNTESPEQAKEIARAAYEAARKNGYSEAEIKIQLVDYPREFKVDEKKGEHDHTADAFRGLEHVKARIDSAAKSNYLSNSQAQMKAAMGQDKAVAKEFEDTPSLQVPGASS